MRNSEDLKAKLEKARAALETQKMSKEADPTEEFRREMTGHMAQLMQVSTSARNTERVELAMERGEYPRVEICEDTLLFADRVGEIKEDALRALSSAPEFSGQELSMQDIEFRPVLPYLAGKQWMLQPALRDQPGAPEGSSAVFSDVHLLLVQVKGHTFAFLYDEVAHYRPHNGPKYFRQLRKIDLSLLQNPQKGVSVLDEEPVFRPYDALDPSDPEELKLIQRLFPYLKNHKKEDKNDIFVLKNKWNQLILREKEGNKYTYRIVE